MSFEWRHSRAGNRYCKRGVFLCTVFPDQRKGGYAYVISNTENDRKEFGNDFETENDALDGAAERRLDPARPRDRRRRNPFLTIVTGCDN